jgi:hypothetical protein
MSILKDLTMPLAEKSNWAKTVLTNMTKISLECDPRILTDMESLVSVYYRDCRICLRRISILLNRYLDEKEIPIMQASEVRKMFLDLTSKRFDNLQQKVRAKLGHEVEN